MAITTAMCTGFKLGLLQGAHDFRPGGGEFFLALYGPGASLGPDTAAYAPDGEVSGAGYSAGGKALASLGPASEGSAAFASFGDVSWSGATFTARGAMIYNRSAGNAAVSVHDFGVDVSVVSGDLSVSFPAATAASAILRIA